MTELQNFVMNNWFVFTGIIAAFWVCMCVNILKPNEMGIIVTLGKPAKEGKNSGLALILWPIQTLMRFPKTPFEFKFRTKSIMSKRGKVEGYNNKIETAEIDVDCTVYAQFDFVALKKTAQFTPGTTAEKLGPYLIPYCNDAVRALGGRIPWRLLNQERLYSSEWILARLKGGVYHEIDDGDEDKPIRFAYEKTDKNGKEMKPHTKTITEDDLEELSPFVIIGLKNINFTIEDVNFTNSELQDAVSAPETARLQAEAKVLEAGGQKEKLILEGEGDAEARSAMIKAIKKLPDLEVLKTLREMAHGQSNTIFQLPSIFENRLKSIFGGNSPQSFFNSMPDADRGVFISELSEAIAKHGKKAE